MNTLENIAYAFKNGLPFAPRFSRRPLLKQKAVVLSPSTVQHAYGSKVLENIRLTTHPTDVLSSKEQSPVLRPVHIPRSSFCRKRVSASYAESEREWNFSVAGEVLGTKLSKVAFHIRLE